MPKQLLSKQIRDRMRQQIRPTMTVDPQEDLGWLLGAVDALLDHAELMDERLADCDDAYRSAQGDSGGFSSLTRGGGW